MDDSDIDEYDDYTWGDPYASDSFDYSYVPLQWTRRRVGMPAELLEETSELVASPPSTAPEKVVPGTPGRAPPGSVDSLFYLAAEAVASTQPFEAVEMYDRLVRPVPDEVQLVVMKAAFPVDKQHILQIAYLSRKRSKCSNPTWKALVEKSEVEKSMQIGVYSSCCPTCMHGPSEG